MRDVKAASAVLDLSPNVVCQAYGRSRMGMGATRGQSYSNMRAQVSIYLSNLPRTGNVGPPEMRAYLLQSVLA